MSKLTGAQMKYLHIIYKSQKGDNGVRPVDISRKLGMSKASVCRMVKLLAELGFVSIGDRGSVRLTPLEKAKGVEIDEKFVLC